MGKTNLIELGFIKQSKLHYIRNKLLYLLTYIFVKIIKMKWKINFKLFEEVPIYKHAT